MANRVTIRIHNQNYNILAEEDESYIQQCAEIVKNELDQAMAGTALSITDGAVLTALNIADKYSKERQVSDNLRAQLKQALDENARLAKELADWKKKKQK
ncbi:MAG: cell division protein ZapA [Bacillota bacterium]|nr:cell division protein ZapA [Bacillota bacterium]